MKKNLKFNKPSTEAHLITIKIVGMNINNYTEIMIREEIRDRERDK